VNGSREDKTEQWEVHCGQTIKIPDRQRKISDPNTYKKSFESQKPKEPANEILWLPIIWEFRLGQAANIPRPVYG